MSGMDPWHIFGLSALGAFIFSGGIVSAFGLLADLVEATFDRRRNDNERHVDALLWQVPPDGRATFAAIYAAQDSNVDG